MQLYNSLTRTVEPFRPLHEKVVTMYSCGPTVYDHIHIGNLSAFIIADTLRRALLLAGYHVTHVMNFTDVDDKTIRRSAESYPELDARTALETLTAQYGALFLDDMTAVGNDVAAMQFPKATEAISHMQTLIRRLHVQGFAYLADDGVYFSIAAYTGSGKRYGQLVDLSEASTSAARIANDEYDKEQLHDFALWKVQKAGEPAWPFQIDGKQLDGRPGWHIECSAMSTEALGQPFDIHTGGVDLKFPHHENEIAQSTAGRDDVRYATTFVHNEHLLVDGQKMSKSLNNFYTLRDIIDRGYDPLGFRLLVLQSHYRKQTQFSWDNLEAACSRLKRLRGVAELRHQLIAGTSNDTPETLSANRGAITSAVHNDLNTPVALASIDEALDVLDTSGLLRQPLELFQSWLELIDDVLGLNILATTPDITTEQKQLIEQRTAARARKDWAASDQLRDALTEQSIGLNDTSDGTLWYRL